MNKWENDFELHILMRGLDYAHEGVVHNLTKGNNRISAIVEGSEYYKVDIEMDGDEIEEAYCSCPYAAKGYMCKHMAAVLFVASADQDRIGVTGNVCKDAIRPESTTDIIHSAKREDLESILIEMANNDMKADSHIRSALMNKSNSADVNNIKRQIDSTFYAYSDRGGFIDYYNAFEFQTDINRIIEDSVAKLTDNGDFLGAFDVSKYAFVKLGNWDIDDDGEISSISDVCYRSWQGIVSGCSKEDLGIIKGWFEEHAYDGTVIDYMEDTLQDFLRFELASKEELLKEIRELDEVVESCSDQNKCKTVFTSHYGYNIEAIELRMILMRKIGADEREIDAYRREHLNFKSVREFYIRKARDEKDFREEIRLLIMSKELDSDSAYLVHSYSERLIDIYNELGMVEEEKKERRDDILSYSMFSMDAYGQYKCMCSKKEWSAEVKVIVDSIDDTDKKCKVYAEENMLQELFDAIFADNSIISLLDKYGFLLAENYSKDVLGVYSEYVSSLADAACNRARYNTLIEYLRRMQQYKGGSELVSGLAKQWINTYPTRRVMVEELNKFI